MPTPKTTVAIVLKSGASVAVKTHWSHSEVEKAYENAWDSSSFLRIETSDPDADVVYFQSAEIAMISIRKEKSELVRGPSLIVPRSD